MRSTPNNLIYIGSPISFDTDKFFEQLKELMKAAYENVDNDTMKELVKKVVINYNPTDNDIKEVVKKAI